MTRWIGDQGDEILDCIRPDGTWVNPPLPPRHPVVPYAAVRAFGNLQALLVDGYAHLHRFDGTSWTDLGPEPAGGFIIGPDIDAAGNIWLLGTFTGGAFRRDAETGFWQRYRVTNTSQFDFFNEDVAIDPHTGDVYACANASSGIGGMVKFDGTRWTGFVNQDGYGLTGPWPWPGAPQSEAVYVRPSNGHVVANPINQFTHEFDGTSWTELPADRIRWTNMSRTRSVAVGHRSLRWSGNLRKRWLHQCPRRRMGCYSAGRPGSGRNHLVQWSRRGDRAHRRQPTASLVTMDDFPVQAAIGSIFRGLAADHNGIAWVGQRPRTEHRKHAHPARREHGHPPDVAKHDLNWPFPGEHVYSADGHARWTGVDELRQ